MEWLIWIVVGFIAFYVLTILLVVIGLYRHLKRRVPEEDEHAYHWRSESDVPGPEG